MKLSPLVAGLFGLAISTPAVAVEYLTEITSEVYQASGTPKELATRAATCISQNLAPGTTDSQLILSIDLDGGVIVARNVLSYTSFTRWQIRSTFTFEAREGRFRIKQTNLERYYDPPMGWAAIPKAFGSDWKKPEEAFTASATAVASCVIRGSQASTW